MSGAADQKPERLERSVKTNSLLQSVLAGAVLATAAGIALADWIRLGAFGITIAVVAALAVFTTWLRFALWFDRKEETGGWSILVGLLVVGAGLWGLSDPSDDYWALKARIVVALGSLLVIVSVWSLVARRRGRHPPG